jgi:hypothetical protein
MKLSWFRRSKITVEVLDDEILVTMPGTSFSIVYEKTKDNQLIASSFSARKDQDEKRKVQLPTVSCPCLDSGKREGKGAWLVSRDSR